MKPTRAVQQYIINKQSGYVDKDHNPRATKELLLLNFGENISGVPPQILEQLGDLQPLIARYPDQTYSHLIEVICQIYTVTKNMVSVGTGANELIERISRIYLQPHEEVTLLSPSFFRFADAALRQEAKINHIHLLQKNNYDLTDEIVKLLLETKPKILWLCNPNNPTGRIVQQKIIDHIATEMKDTLICIDEAWGEYVDNWDYKHSAINLLVKHKNILVIRTFSKWYGMAGLTLGYTIGSEELIKPLNSIRLEFPISGMAEKLATLILENRASYNDYKEKIKSEVTRVMKILDKLSSIEYIPTNTSIITIRHRKKSLYKELYTSGILVSDLSDTQGLQGKQYVRVTIQPDRTSNDKLIEALQQIEQD